jgi:lysophospholipase L1-like esterase
MAPRDLTDEYLKIWTGVNDGIGSFCETEGWLFFKALLDAVGDTKARHVLRDDINYDSVHFNHKGYEILGKGMAEDLRGRVEAKDVILLYGDSITAGYPYYEPVLSPGTGDPKHSYGYWLEELLGAKVVNLGISGDTTRGILERFQDDGYSAKFAIFQGGGNDVIEHIGMRDNEVLAGQIVENLHAMGSVAIARKMTPAFVPLLQFDPSWG